MGSLSDTLLGSAAMPNLDAVHSEPIKILDGVDAGKIMYGILSNEPDANVSSETLDLDPRQKTICRFTLRPGNIPSVNTKRLVKIQTQDGKRWAATKQDFSAYLSTDFELVQII